jgi:peptide/nickel transport system permease protein
MVGAVLDSDYPVAQAAFLLIAVLTVLGNLIADLLYGFVDPRIRYG